MSIAFPPVCFWSRTAQSQAAMSASLDTFKFTDFSAAAIATACGWSRIFAVPRNYWLVGSQNVAGGRVRASAVTFDSNSEA